uniref:PDZ domain-containing protein n=1 Tax=Panagrolaimus davidi TaxID=227884 RepID=A0A914PEU9_9BILA
MVLNGTTSSNGVNSTDHNTVIKNNYIGSNGNGVYQASNNSSNNDYPTYNGTVSRRSVINGSSPYKNSIRVGHNANNKLMNGSSRNSISSYSSSFTNGSNGYENGSSRTTRQSPTRQHSNSPTSITSEDSTVVVRMVPDAQDRFGFNVSGGYDRGYPVIVSRVVSGSPADRCHPRLNVGL